MALHRSWLCDDDEVCVETTQMTLCTEHSEDPDVKCVLQEGLYIDGKPVWASAPVVDPPRQTLATAAVERCACRMAMLWRGDCLMTCGVMAVAAASSLL